MIGVGVYTEIGIWKVNRLDLNRASIFHCFLFVQKGRYWLSGTRDARHVKI